ncbi:MAG: hypothetical protein WEC34_03035 [Acidimicrobiia bacterium]
MRGVATTSWCFLREQMRAPLVLVLLLVLPMLFVVMASSVLSDFSRALGGSAHGDGATALAAGWSVAFLAGALGFFVTMSSHEADQRLAIAGLGPARTAIARLMSALGLAVTVTAAAFVALRLQQPIPHAAHTLLAMSAYACIYLAIGTAVGSVIRDALAGSLLVVFIFLLDVFSGPGMSKGTSGLATLLSPSQKAGELLLAAGAGTASAGPTWTGAAISVAVALGLALGAFWYAARTRR